MKTVVSLARSKDHFSGVSRSLLPLRRELARALTGVPAVVIKINMVVAKTPRYPRSPPRRRKPAAG
ncbi:MAG: hypothetical protein JW929_04565 [Anaerolineales bacterium]|nr:hypothetical protein [Anaerolineales bacterium]